MVRCINLDWLEVYALEDPAFYPMDAFYFQHQGWTVEVRPYGTRVFSEMFTLMDSFDNPILEIRRNPLAQKRDGSAAFLDPRAVHIRLHNRTCYFDNAASLLQHFLDRYHYDFQRIKRVDLALDFITFDSGDDPAKFLARFLAGRYSKINQANVSAHGKDEWEQRKWQSISWGSKKSMVSTKLYCKTTELREVHDKSYIRQAWAKSGLVDNFMTLEKHLPDGMVIKPDIWRLEFSIASSVKNWVVLEDCSAGKKQLRSIRNTLQRYSSREEMMHIFPTLVDHYFHFKYYEAGKRKDRCKDKVLFKFQPQDTSYTIERVSNAKKAPLLILRLIKYLEEYRALSPELAIKQQITKLLELLQDKRLRLQLSNPFSDSELEFLRSLLSYRTTLLKEESVSESMENVKALMRIWDDVTEAQ